MNQSTERNSLVTNDARVEIGRMIESDDLVGLLHKTAQLHGHHCVGSAMGVIAANHAMKTMRIVRNTGMEHLIAVVETNSCFSDARAQSHRGLEDLRHALLRRSCSLG